jgi:Fe-S-cluster containining protein
MKKITDADCRSCGACCVASGDGGDVLAYGYADLTSKDVALMTPHVRRQLLETFIGGETRHSTQAKRLASGGAGCQYLRGTPGERCSCSIYATRPEICQKFRVGGEPCRAARLELLETRARQACDR